MKKKLKINLNILIISFTIGLFLVSCSYFKVIKSIHYFKNPPIYSSYKQVDSIIAKQLKEEKINYIILYGNDVKYSSKPIYFDRNRNLLPYTGCSIPSYEKNDDTLAQKNISSFTKNDTLNLKDLIQNLTDKDSLSFDSKILSNYKYIVVIDIIAKLKFESDAIDNIRKKTDIDSVFFIFINKDLYEWSENAEKLKNDKKLKIKLQKK